MIARENANDAVINLLIFFSWNLKKITSDPSIVDKPAMVDISKAPIISI